MSDMSNGERWEDDAVVANAGEEDDYITVWRTKEGKQIKIEDLTDSHLLNIIKMLERFTEDNYEDELAEAASFASSMHGDMSSYHAEQAFDEVGMKEPNPFKDYPIYLSLYAEAVKRGLIS